jgi:hypothetical protein
LAGSFNCFPEKSNREMVPGCFSWILALSDSTVSDGSTCNATLLPDSDLTKICMAGEEKRHGQVLEGQR